MVYEEHRPEADPTWVATLLDAAFGGPWTGAFAGLVDADQLTDLVDLGGMTLLMRTGAPRAVGVRFPATHAAVQAAARGVAGLPPDAPEVAFVDDHGDEGVRVLAAVQQPGERMVDGAPYLGEVAGGGGSATLLAHLGPIEQVGLSGEPARIAAAIAAALPGPWVKMVADGKVRSAVLIADGASPTAVAAALEAVPDLPAWRALSVAYTDRGLFPRSVTFEVRADGVVEVGILGVWSPTQVADQLADASASEVYDQVVASVPEADRPAAREVIATSLRPALAQIWPGDSLTSSAFATMMPEPAASLEAHEAELARHVLQQAALVEPSGRVDLLRLIVAPARAAALVRAGYALSVARYKLKYPDVADAPQIPLDVLALSEAEIVARATRLRQEAGEVADALAADPMRHVHSVPGHPCEIALAIEMLDRAIDGQFVAAPGPLFDYLDQIGRGAIEDDPSLISMEHVDLEPGERDAALSALESDLADDIDEMSDDDLDI